jgi:prolyl-tRNA synthetase
LKQNEKAEGIYGMLRHAGIEVLYDDRDLNPGQKFADADLIGMPYQLIVSEKNLKDNKIEIKKRADNSIAFLDLDKNRLVNYFKSGSTIETLASPSL